MNSKEKQAIEQEPNQELNESNQNTTRKVTLTNSAKDALFRQEASSQGRMEYAEDNDDANSDYESSTPFGHNFGEILSQHPEFLEIMRKIKTKQENWKQKVGTRMKQAKHELRALFVVIIAEALCAYLMSLFGVIASIRAPQNMGQLPDIGFDTFQYLKLPHWANEMMTLIVSDFFFFRSK